MEWEFIAPMIVSVVLVLTVGGVVLLRPVTKRLGALLDVMVLEKQVVPDRRRSPSRDHRYPERQTFPAGRAAGLHGTADRPRELDRTSGA